MIWYKYREKVKKTVRYAGVAELADAQVSKTCGDNTP